MENDLSNRLTIENATETAKNLKEQIINSENPVIDLSAVEKIDLSGIQLLISAQKTGPKYKKSVYYSGLLVKGVSERITASGFKVVHSSVSEDFFTIRRNSSEI